MTRYRFLWHYLVLLLLLTAAGCGVLDPNPQATVTGPPPTDTTAEVTGQAIYEQQCAICHGLDGTPRVNADHLNEYDGTFEEFDVVLLKPPPLMPIFSYERIDTAGRALLYDYIQTFE